jgi:predicted HTH domain antitoxin
MNSKQEEMIQMHEAGLTTLQIAKELEVTASYVRLVLRKAGKPANISKQILTDEQEEDIIQQVLSGTIASTVMHKYGLNYNQFYSIMYRNRIDLDAVRKEAQDMRKLRLETAVKMYEHGDPYWKISETTGLTASAVTKELHVRGIPLRQGRQSLNINVNIT